MRVGGKIALALSGLMPDIALANAPVTLDVPAIAPPEHVPAAVQFSLHTVASSDYRFRGTSYSQGEPVAQATLVAAHDSGLFGGVFVSSLGNHDIYGAVEIDLFAGFAKPIAPGVTAEINLLYYYYPDANPAFPNTNSFETAVQIAGEFGAFSPKVGAWYAWEQAALGGRDNLYLFGDLVWRVPGTPLATKVHAGWTKGAYSISADRTSVDWSAGVTLKASDKIRLGVEYVGMGGPRVKDFSDDTVVASVSFDF